MSISATSNQILSNRLEEIERKTEYQKEDIKKIWNIGKEAARNGPDYESLINRVDSCIEKMLQEDPSRIEELEGERFKKKHMNCLTKASPLIARYGAKYPTLFQNFEKNKYFFKKYFIEIDFVYLEKKEGQNQLDPGKIPTSISSNTEEKIIPVTIADCTMNKDDINTLQGSTIPEDSQGSLEESEEIDIEKGFTIVQDLQKESEEIDIEKNFIHIP